MWLNNFIFYLGTLVIIITLLVALLFKDVTKPQYFDYIFLIIYTGIFISINTFLFKKINLYPLRVGLILQDILIVAKFLFMCLFFYHLQISKISKKRIKFLIIASILTSVSLIVIANLGYIYFPQIIIQNVVLITFSAAYFLNILKGKLDIILFKSSVFWLVLGIFFWATVSFPVYCLYFFIPINEEYREIINRVFSISNISLMVMYMLFIKSYLCLTPQRNLQ